jgi:hypothetical protein
VDGRAVFSDVVRTHHANKHYTKHSQKALGTLPVDGNVMPKHVGATIHNKLNEYLLHFFVFHAYINEMHGSRRKIPSKKSR